GYEPIEERSEEGGVLVVDKLLRDQGDLADVARSQWGETAAAQLKRERQIAKMAVENIINNVQRLVKSPTTHVTHLSNLAAAVEQFGLDSIVLIGTLRDFDFYTQE